MTSAPSWTRRAETPRRRLCARPGCGARAVATLRFQPTERHAWLVDLDETAARTHGDLCHRHAATLLLPRGWQLDDERTEGASVPVDETAMPAVAAPRAAAVRRDVEPEPESEEPVPPIFAAASLTLVDVAPNGDGGVHLDGGAVEAVDPVSARAVSARAVPAQFGANDDDLDDGALDAILDARTPLLRRAFRNAQSR